MLKLTAAAAVLSGLFIEVFRVNGLLLEAGDVITAPLGLTSARWQVLGVVDQDPVPVATVARTMGLTRQSVQLTADALERDRFIEYVDNPHHRRAKLIAITEAGRSALREVEARHATWANRLGRQLDAGALRAAAEGLQQVREHLEQDLATMPERKA